MTGSSVGFRSASGTSYPTNVRLEFQTMPESQWLQAVHTRAGHPPMIWQDLRAVPMPICARSISLSNRSARPAFSRRPHPALARAGDAVCRYRVQPTPR